MKASTHFLFIACSISLVVTTNVCVAQPHHVDVSLQPISADEPIEPNGFPPLPKQVELPIAEAHQQQQLFHKEKLYGGGYKHAETPVPPRPDPFESPRIINQVLSGAQNAPTLQKQYEKEKIVDPPQGIFIDQARIQDLSLPDDQQQKNSNGGSGNASRLKRNLQNNLLRPIRSLNRFGY